MLGHPALITRHGGGDAQGEALLAQEGVAAVAGAVGPDLAGLREVGDVLRLIAWPRHIGAGIAVSIDERVAHRMHGRHEISPLPDLLERRGAHAGHDLHVDHDVRRVRELDTELGDVRAERAHRERDDVHWTSAHAAFEEALQDPLHLDGVHPVVRGTSVGLELRADVRAALDAGDVTRGGACQERVGAQFGVESHEHAAVDHLLGESIPLGLGAVTPNDLIGLGECGDLFNPLEQLLVARRRVLQAGNGHRSSEAGRGLLGTSCL